MSASNQGCDMKAMPRASSHEGLGPLNLDILST